VASGDERGTGSLRSIAGRHPSAASDDAGGGGGDGGTRRSRSASARVKEGAETAREYRRAIAGLDPASLIAMYPDFYAALPAASEKTFAAMARHGAVVNSKRMGYADPRPDFRPSRAMMPAVAALYPEQQARTHHVFYEPRQALDVVTEGTGLQGKAEAAWAAQLRPNLHSTAGDPRSAHRTGRQIATQWGAGGLAPSDTATGYAYRHAAAHSMLMRSGTVYDRLTDSRGYTGTAKHRFDVDGRGLGLAGRENSIDYQFLVRSMPVDEVEGQAPLPTAHLSDLRQHTAGMGRK